MSDTRPYVYAYQALQKRWAFTPLNGQTFVRNHVALERWSKYRFVMCRTTYSHAQADQMTRLAANGQLDEPFVRLFTVMDTLEGNQVVMAVVKPLDTDHEIRLRLADGNMKTCIHIHDPAMPTSYENIRMICQVTMCLPEGDDVGAATSHFASMSELSVLV